MCSGEDSFALLVIQDVHADMQAKVGKLPVVLPANRNVAFSDDKNCLKLYQPDCHAFLGGEGQASIAQILFHQFSSS